jgi:hypothetical protein
MSFCKSLFWVAAGVLSIAIAARADEPPASSNVDIVASGIGKDETAATKDALSNAVCQAIGQFVSADTLVQNDQLVRDQILTYSDGFVEHYDAVGKPRQTDGGLISVTIRASVRRSKLLEKVKASNISVMAVDGKNLFGEAVTKQEQRAKAADLAAKEFSGAQQALIKTELAGKPTYDDKTRVVNATLMVDIDQDAYRKFVQRIEQVLDQTATEQATIAGEGHFGGGQPPGLTSVNEVVDLRRSPSPVLVVCERMSNDLKSSRWRAYALAPEVMAAVRRALEPISISVDLLDEHGEVVDSCNIPFNKNFGPYSSFYLSTPIVARDNWIMVAPVSGGHPGLGYWEMGGAFRTRSIPVTFALTLEQLRGVASIRCTVMAPRGSSAPTGTDKAGQPK